MIYDVAKQYSASADAVAGGALPEPAPSAYHASVVNRQHPRTHAPYVLRKPRPIVTLISLRPRAWKHVRENSPKSRVGSVSALQGAAQVPPHGPERRPQQPPTPFRAAEIPQRATASALWCLNIRRAALKSTCSGSYLFFIAKACDAVVLRCARSL